MINVIAYAVPQNNKEDKLRDALRDMLVPTRAEAGCRRYELYEAENGSAFYIFEEWENQQAFDAHLASPHIKHLLGTIDDLTAQPLAVTLLRPLSPIPAAAV